jgi:hypothetical protein
LSRRGEYRSPTLSPKRVLNPTKTSHDPMI